MATELLVDNLVAHWIQAGVLATVAMLGVAVVRIRQPRVLLRYWQALLLLTLALPWIQPWQALTPSTGTVTYTGLAAGEGSPGESVTTVSGVDPWPWLLALLAAGMAVRLAWIVMGVLQLGRLARHARRVPPPEAAHDIQSRLGVGVRYLQDTRARAPFSFGAFVPTIVLPAGFDALEPAFQRAIVGHELLHVKRRDFVTALAEEIVVALLWFHPWVWLIRSRIRLAREQVVDAEVVRVTGDRSAYVQCLVAIAGHRLVPRLVSSMLHSRELRVRVDALFEEVGMSKRHVSAVATALCLLLGMTTWLSASTVPLRAMSGLQGAAALASGTQQPSARSTRMVVLDFTLESGHQPQTRGLEGQLIRIWLRDAGKFGFVPTIREADRVVALMVYDLESVPDRQLSEIEVVVGGDPVTFGTSPSFEVSVPRIVDFSAMQEERLREQEQRRLRVSLLAAMERELRGMLEFRELAVTTERAAVALEELQRVAESFSQQLGAEDTATVELKIQLEELRRILDSLAGKTGT